MCSQLADEKCHAVNILNACNRKERKRKNKSNKVHYDHIFFLLQVVYNNKHENEHGAVGLNPDLTDL